MPLYQVYGLSVASEYPLHLPPLSASTEAHLTFAVVASPPASVDGLLPSCTSRTRDDRGKSVWSLYRMGRFDVLRLPGADYFFERHSIRCHLTDAEAHDELELRLLGLALPFWLEREQVLALHCSAVEVSGHAVGFLSSSQGGKSSLAAAMVRRGHRLLTDDVLPLEERDGHFLALPGYPQMRMWPDLAEHLGVAWRDLERVHPAIEKRRVPVAAASFVDKPLALATLFVPEHRNDVDPSDRIDTTTFPPSQALVELVRHSYWAALVQALGWQPGRLDRMARALERVPLRRLVYSPGLDRLPAVCEAVVAQVELDLESAGR